MVSVKLDLRSTECKTTFFAKIGIFISVHTTSLLTRDQSLSTEPTPNAWVTQSGDQCGRPKYSTMTMKTLRMLSEGLSKKNMKSTPWKESLRRSNEATIDEQMESKG